MVSMIRSVTRTYWAATLTLFTAVRADASLCDALRSVSLPNTTIAAVTFVDSGTFKPPRVIRRPSVEFFTAFNALPAFCRVQLVARPSSDSHIRIEVWLPVSNWNGRYLGTGNGGYGGSIGYYRLGEALSNGYVASSTDTGHRGSARQSAWAKGHPEKQRDFDHRAIHLTALASKALVRALHGSEPRFSYFHACSNGGRQGLMEAERYPSDYDGIMAGAPATTFGFRTFVAGDLREFQSRNGKLIIYHGGNDAPGRSIRYYGKVTERLGAQVTEGFLQLYVVPGMGHCGSGDEPNDIGQWLRRGDDEQNSLFKALQRWVEQSVAPEGVTATRFVADGDPASGVAKTRRLYPYPRAASPAR